MSKKRGRPPKNPSERIVNCTVGLTQDEIDAALHIAIRTGVPRRVWLRQVIHSAILDELRNLATGETTSDADDTTVPHLQDQT